MLGKTFGMLFGLIALAVSVPVSAVDPLSPETQTLDPPLTRLDVVVAQQGVCRAHYILEAGEKRLIYCDLTGMRLGNFSGAVESGSHDVVGWVSDVWLDGPGIIAVLRNDSNSRRLGIAHIRRISTRL